MSNHVLYVEDEENDVFFMQSAFKKIAPQVTLQIITDGRKAADFFTATENVQSSMPSLVILDLNLPGLTGVQVLRHIRTKSNYANVPVVLFSASSQQKDINTCYSIGCNAYLVKPSDPNRLKDLVISINEFWLKENHCSDSPQREVL